MKKLFNFKEKMKSKMSDEITTTCNMYDYKYLALDKEENAIFDIIHKNDDNVGYFKGYRPNHYFKKESK